MEADKLRVLVITRNAWDDTNSIGNTMSNFFRDQKDVEIANLYFRASKPNNSVCRRYYHVTESELLKHYLSPSRCGNEFTYQASEDHTPRYTGEKKMVSVIHRFSLKPAYMLSDHLWNSKKWINDRLIRFIEDFKPDAVFTFAKSLPQYYHAIRFLHEKYHVKVLLWIGDDEYTALSKSGTKKSQERIRRLRYILNVASKVWGCSEEICTYYNGIFGCDASPLYKRCSFDYPVHNAVNRPLRMVYAGNLLFGRLEILKTIVGALRELNASQTVARLDIYSSTPVSDADREELNVSGTSALCGVVPYDEIQKQLSQADLTLLAESFEDSEIVKTRYSFSTKIIDCLQSGSVILAIGPAEVGSIRYVRRIPGAAVIDDPEGIRAGIAELIRSRDTFPERAAQIRAFAVLNHSQNSGWIARAVE